jgi:hypothetical protein
MSETCLELCGAFASTERWQKAWTLIEGRDCSLQELRISHNTEQQVLETCRALQHNSSVQELHIGVLEEAGAAAVSSLLKVRQELSCESISDACGNASATCPSVCHSIHRAATTGHPVLLLGTHGSPFFGAWLLCLTCHGCRVTAASAAYMSSSWQEQAPCPPCCLA